MYSRLLRYGLVAGIVFAGWSDALPTVEDVAQTHSLVKRAPVNWDWDDTLPNAKENRAKAEEGWQDMLQLAAKIHRKTDPGRLNGIFSHYFNNDKDAKIKAIFRTLVGAKDENDQGNIGPGGGSDVFAYVTITNKKVDDDDDCEKYPDRALAFLENLQNDPLPDPPEDDDFAATIRICDLGYRFPALKDTTCESLDEEVSGKMSTLGGIFLHEITHYDGLFWKAVQLKDGTDDLHGADGYGPKATREIKENQSDDESNNADNYRWFAQEVWWSHVCNKDYARATSNKDYIECHDKDGNEAACEMPKHDKPSTSSPPPPPDTPQPAGKSLQLFWEVEPVPDKKEEIPGIFGPVPISTPQDPLYWWYWYTGEQGKGADPCNTDPINLDRLYGAPKGDSFPIVVDGEWNIKVPDLGECKYQGIGKVGESGDNGWLHCDGRPAIMCKPDERPIDNCNSDTTIKSKAISVCEW